MEHPQTLKSGVVLQHNLSLHHRSDILMEEQIETVHKEQEELRKALLDLEMAKEQEELDKCRVAVQECKEKCEKAIIVLQVLAKINTELQFARAELDEALEKQEGNINEARKRVMWLEDRMGILCGKARLRVQPNQKPKQKSFHSRERTFLSRMGSNSDSEGEGGSHLIEHQQSKSMEFQSGTNRQAGMGSTSESGSDYPMYHQSARGDLADTPSSGPEVFSMTQKKMVAQHGPGVSDSESEDGMPPMLYGIPKTSGPSLAQPSQGSCSSQQYSSSESNTPVPLYSIEGQEQGVSQYSSSVQQGQWQGYNDVKPAGSDTQEERSDKDDFESEAARSKVGHGEHESYNDSKKKQIMHIGIQSEYIVQTDSQTEHDVQIDMQTENDVKIEGNQASQDNQLEDEERQDTAEAEKESLERGRSEISERSESAHSLHSGNSQDTSQNQQATEIDKALFMTEVPYYRTERSVTIQLPTKMSQRAKANTADTMDMADLILEGELDIDQSSKYWRSEHHRFEFSEYSEALLEIDPLSYHAMGLAVPGSFIDKPTKTFERLPWRPLRRGSDINDIHKVALDKLANRLHSMYDKLYEAAQMSVHKPYNTDARRESTMFSSYDASREGARSGTPSESRAGMYTAPPTVDGLPRQPMAVTEIVPSKLRTGLNVYHPKPIPPPEVLPVTRTSKDKEYPRLSNAFYEADDILTHRPAVRIVDQQNLYKDTKLHLYKDHSKRSEDGPSTTEKKFRMMLEKEKSMVSQSTHSSKQTTPLSSRTSTRQNSGKRASGTRLSMVRTVTKAETRAESETGASSLSWLKPSSRSKAYAGLKWERVKTLVHVNLVSIRPEERRDAAKHLGLLRCGDAMVFYALKERLKVDNDFRTKYEAAKSLILLGCWEDDVLQVMLKYLVIGNTEIRQDLISNMIDGKNVQYVNKKVSTFPELVKVLCHFCRNPDPSDTIAFDAAVLLGKLCVMDENAKYKLLWSLDQSNDTHMKAKALDVLVKQLNCTSWAVVQHLLALFQESPVWRYRALAADLLIVLGALSETNIGDHGSPIVSVPYQMEYLTDIQSKPRNIIVSRSGLGKKNVCKQGEEERIYQILERKLWDDPNKEVRISAAKTLAALGMFSKACDRIEKRLEDSDEDIRAQAVISVGTLEMKTEKIIRLLLEMLELDASEYVRLMIARTFTILKFADKRIIRALRERDKVEGALARESRKALKVLESLGNQSRITLPIIRKSMGSRASAHGITPHYTPAVIV